ncbi:MAG TPA: DMT family transporter [Candidatus Eisenbacteria bacterium]|nr:DMT family transporter [Candidatus Eisenbacteria bacterium]
MVAIVLALGASLWFALAMVFINRGVISLDYFRGLLVNLGLNALFLWIYVLFFAVEVDFWAPVYLLFVLVGVFVPGIARLLIFQSMERLGASISSCLTNSAPLFATCFAVLFLRERPGAMNVIGTFSIVLGITLLSWRGATKTWRTKDLLYPLAAAFLFAARDNLVRVGVLQIESPILGASIAATTSFTTMALIYGAFENKKPIRSSAARGFVWFAGAGFMNFLSYVFAYTALSMERVSIISPLINASSLFVLPLSWLFLQDVERLSGRKVAAVLLVILGVFFISWETH